MTNIIYYKNNLNEIIEILKNNNKVIQVILNDYKYVDSQLVDICINNSDRITVEINLNSYLYTNKNIPIDNLNNFDSKSFISIQKIKNKIINFKIIKENSEFNNVVIILRWLFNTNIHLSLDLEEEFDNTDLFRIMKSLSFIEKYFSNVRDWLYLDIFDHKTKIYYESLRSNNICKTTLPENRFDNFTKVIRNFYNCK
jgi:hypothetical protein